MRFLDMDIYLDVDLWLGIHVDLVAMPPQMDQEKNGLWPDIPHALEIPAPMSAFHSRNSMCAKLSKITTATVQMRSSWR